MNKYLEQIVFLCVAIVLVIIDIGLSGVIVHKDLVMLSILFLQILVNLNFKNSFVMLFVIIGMFIDWHNKVFFGLTPLIFVVSLYLFNAFKIRFYGNKLFTSIINLVFGFVLMYSFNGFKIENLFYSLVGACICTGLISYLWLRK